MALMADLLAQLERNDTLPGADAIERVMIDGAPAGWSEGSLTQVWHSMDQLSRDALASWASARLDHWHSLKTNALFSAWESDPGPEVEHRDRCDAILRTMLMDLRAGLGRHPELLPDAVALQQLAEAGHAFSWSQAYKELCEEQAGFSLEPSHPDFVLYCQLSSYAFRWLLTEGGQ